MHACRRDGRGGSPTAVLCEADAPPDLPSRCRLASRVGASHAVLVAGHGDVVGLRFYTAAGELPACGHGTVAALAFLAARSGVPDLRVTLRIAGRLLAARVTGGIHAVFEESAVTLRLATTAEQSEVLPALGFPTFLPRLAVDPPPAVAAAPAPGEVRPVVRGRTDAASPGRAETTAPGRAETTSVGDGEDGPASDERPGLPVAERAWPPDGEETETAGGSGPGLRGEFGATPGGAGSGGAGPGGGFGATPGSGAGSVGRRGRGPSLGIPVGVLAASTGRWRLLVPVESRAALAAMTPDLDQLRDACERLGLLGCYVHTPPDWSGRLAARMFAPAIGVPEEVANANSTACLAAAMPGREIAVDMGDSLGIPATVIAAARPGGTVEVGGEAVVTEVVHLACG